MIIYKITNKINDKSYIGQSINGFNRRYDGGKWWLYNDNIALRRAVKKYGIENFYVEFLDENIESREKLNELEIYYIDKFDTLVPNGYNFLPGGNSREHHKETRDKASKTNRKGIPYRFKSPDGEIFEFFNLTNFCEDHDLSRTMMIGVDRNKYKQHKGWTLPNIYLEEKKFKDPHGNIYVLKERELRPFCRKHGLHHFGMIEVWKGTFKQFKGWTKA